jgi:hypothetical protein
MPAKGGLIVEKMKKRGWRLKIPLFRTAGVFSSSIASDPLERRVWIGEFFLHLSTGAGPYAHTTRPLASELTPAHTFSVHLRRP